MKVFDKKSTDFLKKYMNNPSPTGYEASGQKIWLDYIKPYVDETELDTYGTAYGVINPGKKFKVVIEAHADEISWFVNYIDKKGLIYVIRNGGSDHLIAPSMRVAIHTRKKGIVQGVFGWPAIHTRRGKMASLKPEINNIFIDVGAKSKEEVLDMGIDVGNVITFQDGLMELNKNYYTGRALDNKMGGFCIAQVARKLKEAKKKLPYSLYVVNAVQEEVGLRGAGMIASRINPNCAIITDVTHDTSTPMISEKEYCDVQCGNGPSLTFAPSVHNKLLDIILTTAEKKKISIQKEAASRSTGTDTDAFAYSGAGIPSALISLPLKYMHTTVETAHKSDIEGVINLIFESLYNIKTTETFKYF